MVRPFPPAPRTREIAERNDFDLLKDIGVSREEALREANKPFWLG
jgi:uncharacterized protein YjiS (DUF1127 family)